MTDKPAESAVERYNALEWVPDGEMGFDPGGREVKDAADAAIAALEAEVALRDQMLHAIWLGHKKWKVPTADTEDEWLADLRARAEKEAER